MRYLMILLAIALVALAGCDNADLPPEPVEPLSENLAGQATYGQVVGASGNGQVSSMDITPDPVAKGVHPSAEFTAADTAVYRHGYYNFGNTDWELFELEGTALGGEWLSGEVSYEFLADEMVMGNENAILIYSCSRTDAGWDCHGDEWQSMEFAVSNPQVSVSTFALSDDTIYVGDEVSATFRLASTGGADQALYYVDWGEGGSDQSQGTTSAFGEDITETWSYDAPGEYRVDLVARWTGADSAQDSGREYVTVLESLPTTPEEPDVLAVCGNDRIDPGEECDDGNTISGDECSSTCELESFDHVPMK